MMEWALQSAAGGETEAVKCTSGAIQFLQIKFLQYQFRSAHMGRLSDGQ
jgi:hypothetical protein